jgi:hypothetical protein
MTDSKVMLCCTRYKVGVDSVWSNYKACKKIIENSDNTFTAEDRVHCPGPLVITIIDSNVGCPSFLPPFHSCEHLTTIFNMDLGHTDNHPTLEMFAPTTLSKDVLYPEQHQAIIKIINNKANWHGLSGGRFHGVNMRLLVPDLATLVERVIKPIIDQIQSKYPSLVCVKYGSIKTLPNCPSQYEGHNFKFQSNYASNILEFPPENRPVSVILALDPLDFIYLPHITLTRKDISHLTVTAGHALMFTNACMHLSSPRNTD